MATVVVVVLVAVAPVPAVVSVAGGSAPATDDGSASPPAATGSPAAATGPAAVSAGPSPVAAGPSAAGARPSAAAVDGPPSLARRTTGPDVPSDRPPGASRDGAVGRVGADAASADVVAVPGRRTAGSRTDGSATPVRRTHASRAALLSPPAVRLLFGTGPDGNDTTNGTTGEPLNVVGSDERRWVSATEVMPNASVVRVAVRFDDFRAGMCTGVLVDEDHVLTAAHCVNGSETYWQVDWPPLVTTEYHLQPDELAVYPGATNESTHGYLPYGAVGVEDYDLYREWTVDRNKSYDIALLELDRNVGDWAGTMSMYRGADQDDPVYTRSDLNVTGYPGDRQLHNDGPLNVTMWVSTDRGTSTSPYTHAYEMDTYGGASGAPVWTDVDGEPRVLSIHAYGHLDVVCIPDLGCLHEGDNSGTRINGDKYDDLTGWRRNDSAPTDRPDLTPKRLFLGGGNDTATVTRPDVVHPGTDVTATFAVRNAGTAPAGCFDVALYAVGATSDLNYSLGSTEVCSLDPFATTTVSVTGTLPSDVALDRPLYLAWRVDSDGEVTEFGEATNDTAHAGNRRVAGELGSIVVAPRSPGSPTPADGATGVAPGTTLSWQSGGAGVTYDVYLEAGDASPDRLVSSGLSSPSYAPALDAGTRYYWRVVAVSPGGVTAESEVWTFTTADGNAPPDAPSNPTPRDGATGMATSLTLSWSGGDPDGDAVSYDVYFGTSPDPSFYTTTSSTSASVSGLQGGTTYYWRVVGDDGQGSTAGPTWSFTTTASGSATVSVESFSFTNEYMDGPLRIHGGVPSTLDSGYLEYVERTSDDGADYDLRVVDERGILVGVLEDDAFDGDDYAVELEMDDGGLFRRPGTHSLDVVVTAHGSGDTFATTTTVDVGLEPETTYDEATLLPVNPRVGETVTLDAAHFTQDSCETSIEGYEWQVIKHPDGNAERVAQGSGSSMDDVSFTADEAGEYYFYVADTADVDGCNLDSGYFWVESDALLPSLRVDGVSVPDTATEGEPITATVTLSNAGDAQGNYLVRFLVDGTVEEVEAYHVDAGESGDTESASFALQAGTHDVTIVVVDSHDDRHTFTRTVTVEDNAPPDEPSAPTPAVGATGVSVTPTLSWSATDPDGDATTYAVRLERGDRTPDATVASGLSTASFGPSRLEHGTTYYWQVVATDEHGASTAGPVWSFTTAPEPNHPPTASLDLEPTDPDAGTLVELNATASSDPDGDVLDYEWVVLSAPDGVDPTLSNGSAIVSLAAAEPGTYEVRLTVSDGQASNTTTATFAADDVTPPTIGQFHASGGADGALQVSFRSDEPLADIEVVLTDGNGSTVATLTEGQFARSDGLYVGSYAVDSRGQYTATLTTARDAAGNDGAANQSDSAVAGNQAPNASFSVSSTNPVAGETVTFDASASTDGDGSIARFEWDFDGDGTTDATGTVVDHAFAASGTAQVTLTVTDDAGATDAETRTLSVDPDLNLNDTSFRVDAERPGAGEHDASVSFGDAVVVSGTIVGPDPCYAAELTDARLDGAVLTVEVAVVDGSEGGVCQQTLVAIDYGVTLSFDGSLPDRVVVIHRTPNGTLTVAESRR